MNLNQISCEKYVSSNSSPILELSVKFASQICHEKINIPLDGTYSADFGIDIISDDISFFYKVLRLVTAALLPKLDFSQSGNLPLDKQF